MSKEYHEYDNYEDWYDNGPGSVSWNNQMRKDRNEYYKNQEIPISLPKKPEPPPCRVLKEHCSVWCKCGSTKSFKWDIWRRTCDQPECKEPRIYHWFQKDSYGWPIELVKNKPWFNLLRLFFQNLRKVFIKRGWWAKITNNWCHVSFWRAMDHLIRGGKIKYGRW